jgi:PilZ domain
MAQAMPDMAGKVPLLPADSGDDRRVASRFTLLIRAAKLISAAGEQLCVIRDASQTGVKLKLFHPLRATGPLELELANGERFAVEQVWQADGHAGFRFPEEVDLARLVESERGQFPSRRLRLRVDVPVRIVAGGLVLDAKMENISQQGAGLLCEEHLALDQLVRLERNGRPPIYAKVRWRRTPAYGLIFEHTFGFEDLARYVEG